MHCPQWPNTGRYICQIAASLCTAQRNLCQNIIMYHLVLYVDITIRIIRINCWRLITNQENIFSLCLSAASHVPGFQLSDVATSLLIITHSKKGQAKGKKQTYIRSTHIQMFSFRTKRLTSSTSPQMLLRNWSLCSRQTKYPCSSPSPDWFRPWASKVTWQVSMKCSPWWRASARPSTCPAWCLSTTRHWRTSKSKLSQRLGLHVVVLIDSYFSSRGIRGILLFLTAVTPDRLIFLHTKT